MVVRVRNAMNYSLNSSVLQHLTSVAGVPGLISCPDIQFHLCFFLYFLCVFNSICSFLPFHYTINTFL